MLRLVSLLGIVVFLALAWMEMRSMIAGLLACYLFASVVGVLID